MAGLPMSWTSTLMPGNCLVKSGTRAFIIAAGPCQLQTVMSPVAAVPVGPGAAGAAVAPPPQAARTAPPEARALICRKRRRSRWAMVGLLGVQGGCTDAAERYLQDPYACKIC